MTWNWIVQIDLESIMIDVARVALWSFTAGYLFLSHIMQEIKKAYRSLALKHHPDKVPPEQREVRDTWLLGLQCSASW